ncbi:MAG: hypothetical protein K9N21_12820 [Deltaproteobacteria bacterium]|nr:hypothetical protein [Deltaproteobacteria bacterium]
MTKGTPTQNSGETKSGSINPQPSKLSVMIDHTGFQDLEETVGSGIALKDPLANKNVIRLLGAFILSDEITLTDPETELKRVRKKSNKIKKKLENVLGYDTYNDSIRTFDYRERNLEEGFLKAAEKMAWDLSCLMGSSEDVLRHHILMQRKKRVLPPKVKVDYISLFQEYSKPGEVNDLGGLRKISEKDKEKPFPWGHVFMLQRNPLKDLLKKLLEIENINENSMNNLLHAYFSKARNELFSSYANSQYFLPAHDRGLLYLEGLRLTLPVINYISPGNSIKIDKKSLCFGGLCPSLSLLGLLALLQTKKRKIRAPKDILKEILEESASQDSNTKLMTELKEFKSALASYIDTWQSDSDKDTFKCHFESFKKSFENLSGAIMEELDYLDIAKDIYEKFWKSLSWSDIPVIPIAYAPQEWLPILLGSSVAAKVLNTITKLPTDMYTTFSTKRKLKSILDEMELTDKVISSILNK